MLNYQRVNYCVLVKQRFGAAGFFLLFKLPIQMMVLCWVSNGIMLMVDHGMVSNG